MTQLRIYRTYRRCDVYLIQRRAFGPFWRTVDFEFTLEDARKNALAGLDRIAAKREARKVRGVVEYIPPKDGGDR